MSKAPRRFSRIIRSVPLVTAALLAIGPIAYGTQILDNPVILSGSVVSQTSTLATYSADIAINGDLTDFTHTLASDPAPAWSLTLPSNQTFSFVRVYNRASCCGERLRDITVSVYSDESATTSLFQSGVLNPGNVLNSPSRLDIPLNAAVSGRVLKIARNVVAPNGSDDSSVLALGEVQLFNIRNVTLPMGTDLTQASLFNLSTRQSSTNAIYAATNAINGNASDFTHTLASDLAPFWEVNLGENFDLQNINIHNRESCCGSRLRDITVEVRNNAGALVFQSALLNPENGGFAFPGGPLNLGIDLLALNGGVPLRGQTVRILRTIDPDLSGSGGNGNTDEANVLSMGEVSIYGGTVVPEPTALALLGLAGFLVGARRWRPSAW